MRGTLALVGLGAALAICAACGGSESPPPVSPPSAPPPPPVETIAVAVTPVPASSSPAAPQAPTADDADPPLDDPNESTGPIALVLELDKAKARFPKKTKPDAQCWAEVAATGDHTKDYAAIVGACGAPTGLAEYAKPVEGKLHHARDPEDVFTMPVRAGYCYRYFAIADATIADLDLLIEKKGGALVGDDKTNGPFAIIDADEPWCQNEDQDVEFHLKVDGPGKGGYTFGVWARPKR
jgi:hypothetical protein